MLPPSLRAQVREERRAKLMSNKVLLEEKALKYKQEQEQRPLSPEGVQQVVVADVYAITKSRRSRCCCRFPLGSLLASVGEAPVRACVCEGSCVFGCWPLEFGLRCAWCEKKSLENTTN